MSTADLEADALRFRKRNRLFYWLATLAVLVVLAIGVLTLIIIVLKGHTMRPATLQQLALVWPPALLYLWALWSIRGMFAALSKRGFVFHDVIAGALTRIGWALTLGAAMSIVLTPMLISLSAPIVGRFAVANTPTLTLGIVGLALIAVAHMIRRAAQLEARAASLSAALDDFI